MSHLTSGFIGDIHDVYTSSSMQLAVMVGGGALDPPSSLLHL